MAHDAAAAHKLNKLPPELAARLIYEAFKQPTRTPVRQEDEPIMAQAERISLRVDGRNVAVYQWGQGERLALGIHGWNARAADFCQLVAPLLGAGYRVVAFDNPGHGESDGETTTLPDVRAILLALQERRPADVVVAHSFGSLCAFYALNHGVSAKHLISISGVCDVSYLVTRYTAAMNLREETLELLKRHLEASFGRASIWEEFSAHNNVSELQARVCMIHDADDDFVELSQSQKLRAALGDEATLHVTHGLGHRRILGDQTVIQHILREIAAPLPAG